MSCFEFAAGDAWLRGWNAAWIRCIVGILADLYRDCYYLPIMVLE